MAVRPENLGVTNGRLAPCPVSPNCVCSHAQDSGHAIQPFTFSPPRETARQKLKEVLAALPRLRVVKEEENYLHVEAKSWLFRLVDDLEFYLTIHAE